jgi:hypothetical protein
MYKMLVTLGPSGTDSETLAKSIAETVILKPSFPEVMEYAFEKELLALIPCGYKKKEQEAITDTWVDLHFRSMGKMEVIETLYRPTKLMCLAKRYDIEVPRNIVIHPATEAYALEISPKVEIHYVDNKPEAVQLTAQGIFDMCIGSIDVVEKFPELKPLKLYNQQMVWVVYKKRISTLS